MRRGPSVVLQQAARGRSSPYVTRDPSWTRDHITKRQEPTVYSSSSTRFKSFRQRGFQVMRDVFSEAEVKELCHQADMVAEKEKSSELLVREPSTNAVRSVFSPHKHDVFSSVACDHRVLACAEEILDDDVYIHQSRINFQRAFEGTGFGWHSDFETWHVEDGMPTMRSLSAVVFLSNNAAYNGALNVIPGSHEHFIGCVGSTPEAEAWKTSLRDALYFGTPSQDTLSDFAHRYGIDSCAAPAGSVLFFDCNLLHASANNISPLDRCNLFFAFNACSNAIGHPYPNGGFGRPEFLATRDPDYLGLPLKEPPTRPCN